MDANFWSNWPHWLLGVVALAILRWVSGWLTGEKAAAFVKDELEKLRTKINENSVLSQLHCDDACIDILESVIPEVLSEVNDATQQALAAGNLSAVDWAALAKQAWAKAKPQITGGANDYLKNSSFGDGEVLAQMVIQRFFKTQVAQAKGLITDAPRAVNQKDSPTGS